MNEARDICHTLLLQLRDLKINMQGISNGFGVLETITSLTKNIPKLGTVISVLHNVIKIAKPAFDGGLFKLKLIDAQVYPYKQRIDSGVDKCERGNMIPPATKNDPSLCLPSFKRIRFLYSRNFSIKLKFIYFLCIG